MCPHNDEICADLRGRPENPVKGIARYHHGTAFNPAEFRHRADLLGQHSFGLALFQADQPFRLVFVDNMHDMQPGATRLRQKTGLPQGPV